jgi:tRNA (guanine37-N1)-methyltransferase
MRVEILSLFPGYFQGPFDESIIKRAREKGLLELHHVDIRDFADGPHRKVDDRPYGGGPGMVLMPGPVVQAVESVKRSTSRVIYLSPQGKQLTAAKCKELAQQEHLILLCGHYEGIDERALDAVVDEEISIGDYVLTNGCLPAIVLVDAVARFIPGVLGHEQAAAEDSFQAGIFDCPHYTRPETFRIEETVACVPEVLRTGHHQEIEKWRKREALKKTAKVRPELFWRYLAETAKTGTEEDGERIRAAAVIVDHLSRAEKFYCERFGFEVIERSDEMSCLEIGDQQLTLILKREY